MPVYEVAVTRTESTTVTVLADDEASARGLATETADEFDHDATDATVLRVLDEDEILDRAHEVVR